MKQPGFSVIVCCFNSRARIAETLRHIFELQTENLFTYEVILVNNNSTDDTVQMANYAADNFNRYSVFFKLVDEHALGLNAARTRGLAESTREYILYCDDDNHLDANYLINAYAVFVKNPSIGILGGWNRPSFLSDQPSWLEDFYGALAIEKEPRTKGPVTWVFGAGMIVSSHLVEQINQRHIKLLLTDRAGKKQSSGGDVELCLLASWLGYMVYYTPQLQLIHKISEERLLARNFLWLNTDNFLPTVQLFLMERLIGEENVRFTKAIRWFIKERGKRSLRAFPRMIAGRRVMLNFVEFYGNIMVIGWIILNIRRLKFSFKAIKSNLYKK